jgi:hypothetical protein
MVSIRGILGATEKLPTKKISQKRPDTVGENGSGCQGRKAGGAGLGTRHLLEPVKQAVDVHRCGNSDLLQMGLDDAMTIPS